MLFARQDSSMLRSMIQNHRTSLAGKGRWDSIDLKKILYNPQRSMSVVFLFKNQSQGDHGCGIPRRLKLKYIVWLVHQSISSGSCRRHHQPGDSFTSGSNQTHGLFTLFWNSLFPIPNPVYLFSFLYRN